VVRSFDPCRACWIFPSSCRSRPRPALEQHHGEAYPPIVETLHRATTMLDLRQVAHAVGPENRNVVVLTLTVTPAEDVVGTGVELVAMSPRA
jgi:hypothetical protein